MNRFKNNFPKPTGKVAYTLEEVMQGMFDTKEEYENFRNNELPVLQEKMIRQLKKESRKEAATAIKKARAKKNLTQSQLAKIVGTDRANISRMENGKQNTSIELLAKIAKATGQSLVIRFE